MIIMSGFPGREFDLSPHSDPEFTLGKESAGYPQHSSQVKNVSCIEMMTTKRMEGLAIGAD